MTGLMDPAVLREIVAEVRQRFPLSRVVEQGVKLIRAGNEWKACCPFHADKTPSFTIYKGDTRWQCFAGCGGGDVLDYVQRRHGVGLIEAVRMLDAGALPVVERQAIESEKDAAAYLEAARRIWQQACEVQETTPAYSYLARRNLGGPVPPVLRYAKLRCKIHDGDNGPRRPALVALVQDVDGEPVGVQRTFLTDEGQKAFGPESKLSLGRVKGGAIRLAPTIGDLCLTEGMEDALSLQRMAGLPAWAAAGASLLPFIALPSHVHSVTIGADADHAGIATAVSAAEKLAEQGRTVRIIYPEDGHKDFNAEMMAEAWL